MRAPIRIDKIHERGAREFGAAWFVANQKAAFLTNHGHYPSTAELVSAVVYNTLRLARGDHAVIRP